MFGIDGAELGEDAVDWASLDPRRCDPRRYDPRRIVRDALLDPTPVVARDQPCPAAAFGDAPFDDEATWGESPDGPVPRSR